jgi:adenylate cyclase
MAREIERKFLLRGPEWRQQSTRSSEIRQGYLSREGGVTVRVRTIDDARGFITIKMGGAVIDRAEFEYEIPIGDARELLAASTGGRIEKRRHHLDLPGGEWVVDEFLGRHAGLVLLEVELPSGDAAIELPGWVGEEVTGNPDYYNSTLAVPG